MHIGLFNTSNFQAGELDTIDKVVVSLRMAEDMPLTSMLAFKPSMSVSAPYYTWNREFMERPEVSFSDPLPAALPGATNTVAIGTSNGLTEGSIYEITSTREQIRILSVVGGVATIRRGVGNYPPAPVPANAETFYIGTAFEEGSFCPPARTGYATSLTNVTQILRDSWGVTGTVSQTESQLFGKRSAKSKSEMFARFARDIEYTRLFGQYYDGVQNGQPFRKMDGVYEMIRKYAPQNVMAAGATVTLEQMDDLISQVFSIVPMTGSVNNLRVGLIGRGAYRVLQKLGKHEGQLNISKADTQIGLQFTSFRARAGTVNFVYHPMMDRHPNTQNSMILLNMDTIEPVHLGNRQSEYKDSVDDCRDAVGGNILAEIGLKMTVPEMNGIIHNFQEAACEPCSAPVSVYVGCFTVSHPCSSGPVSEGSSVTLSISGAQPSTAFTVQLPGGGTLAMTTDANGNAVSDPIVISGTSPEHRIFTIQNPVNSQTIWASSMATVCVLQPCHPGQAIPDSPCVDEVVTAASLVAGSNTDATPGGPARC